MSSWLPGSKSPKAGYSALPDSPPRSPRTPPPPAASIGLAAPSADPVSTPKGVGSARFLRQTQGLATKQFTLLRRNKAQCCCQLVFPVLLLLSLGYNTFLENMWDDAGWRPDDDDSEWSLDCYSDSACFNIYPQFDWFYNAPVANISWSYTALSLAAGADSPGVRDLGPTAEAPGWFTNNNPAYRFEGHPGNPVWGWLGFFGDNITRWTPSTVEIEEDSIEEYLLNRADRIKHLDKEVEKCFDHEEWIIDPVCIAPMLGQEYLVPEAIWEVKSANLASRSLDWTVWVNQEPWSRTGSYGGYLSPGQSARCAHMEQRWEYMVWPECESSMAINDAYSALLREWGGNPNATIFTGAANLLTRDDDYYNPDSGVDSDTQYIYTAVLVAEFAFPLIMYEVIQERQEGLRELMAMNGLAQRAYWLAQFSWNVGWFYGISLVTWIMSYFLDLHGFRWDSLTPLLLFVIGGPAIVSFAYCLAQVFTSTRKALFFGYFWTLAVSAGLMATLNFTLFPLEMSSPLWSMLIPSYALRRVVHLFIAYQSHAGRVPFAEGGVYPPDFWFGVIMLVVDTVLYMAITLYADSVFKHGIGTGRHPLFPLFALAERLGLVDDPTQLEALANAKAANDLDTKTTPMLTAEEDQDAAAERALVESGRLPSTLPLIVRNLRKVYPPSGRAPAKVALAGMSLHMDNDEVLCLLGPNGSGKTTLMNVLVGVHAATGGTATVGGADITRELSAVRAQLGVVQQFDVLFAQLTCMETCIFFCRIQGLSKFEESRVSTHALKLVGLDKESHFLAGNLSGGMRRRLSIAIAICGKPKLIFMDEPTTGLDPETRRALWDIIQELKENRAIMLSTHMMDEAEALSDRVAIMAKGKLTAIGTAAHLKARFSNGYSLSISYNPGARNTANGFVLSLAPHAKVVTEYPGMLTYQIPPPLQVSAVFEAMEERRANHGIRTWGINKASLEDVFLNIVTDEDLDGAESTPPK